MSSSFDSLTTAEVAFSRALDEALAPLVSTGSTLEGVTVPAINAFGAALDAALEPMMAVGETAQQLDPALSVLSSAMEEVGTALASATTSELAFSEALDSLLEPMIAADTEAAKMDETLAIMAGGMFEASTAAETLQATLSETDAALAEMAAAQTAAADAATEGATATAAYDEVLSNFANGSAEAAAAAEATAAASTSEADANAEAAAVLSQYNVTLGDGVVANTSLQAAIDALNNELSKGVGNLEAIDSAFSKVVAAAEKFGFQVVQSAEGLNILAASAKKATASLDETGGMMAYVAGRAAALELGVGQLGFGLGILARSSSVLGPIFTAAFPIIGAVLMVEVIDNLIDKLENVNLEIIKSTVQFDDLASSQMRAADAVEIQNYKLEDQISKFEGRPTENRLAIAADEATQKVNDLNKSLEDALEKEIQLLQTGEIGIFKSVFSGKEETSDIKGSLQPKLEAYLAAAGKVEEANLELQLSESDANEVAVEKAEDTLAEKKKALDEEVANQQAAIAKQKEIQEATGPIPGAKGAGAVGKPAEEVDQAFAAAEAQVNAIHNVELAQELRNEKTQEQIKLDEEAADAADKAEERSRQRTIDEASVKADASTATSRAAIQKQQAEEQFRIAENEAKLQAQQAITAGEDRYKAELAADDKILEARKKLTAELLSIQQTKGAAELSAAEQQLELDQQTEVGAKLEAAITADNAKIQNLKESEKAAEAAITADGNNLIIQLEIQANEELVKLNTERTRRILDEYSKEIAEKKRLAEEDAKTARATLAQQTAEAEAPIQREGKITSLAEKGGGGLIASTLELAQIRATKDEEIKLAQDTASKEEAIENTKATTIIVALQDEERAIARMYLSGQISAEEYAKKTEEIEREITQTTQTEADKRQQIIAREKEQEQKIAEKEQEAEDRLEMQISQGMARELDKMIFQAKSFAQAMEMLWQDLARMIIQEIIKITAEWVTHVLIMKAVEKLLGKDDTAANTGKNIAKIAANTSLATSEVGTAAAVVFAEAIMQGGYYAIPAAIAEAASVEAAGAPFEAQAAAAGGWDVPDDQSSYNTIIHPREMVLDRNISEGLRGIISRGMSTIGGHASETGHTGGVILHYHAGDMHAPTGVGVEEMLNSHPAALTKMISGLVRSGKLTRSNLPSGVKH